MRKFPRHDHVHRPHPNRRRYRGRAVTASDPGPAPLRTPPRSWRSQERAELWQERFDRLVVVASVLAVVGVALQTIKLSDVWPWLGMSASIASWLLCAADAAIMLTVAAEPRTWARSHAFELVVLVAACPLWPIFFYDLLVLQLTPALTVLEATKLAKLVKVARTMRPRSTGRTGGRLLAAAVILSAVAVGVLVFRS